MRQIREFRCHSCGKLDERYIEDGINEVRCECGGVMMRIISAPTVRLEGITGSFPGAADRWARIREENARNLAKKERE